MIQLEPIGVVRSPFAEPSDVPRFAADRADAQGIIDVYPAYREGLRDLEGFSHIVLIWRFHKSEEASLDATPPYDVGTKGVFATRSPKRPNALGLSVVELDSIKDGCVHIRNFDMADGAPVLDIKPYIPENIDPASISLGWLEEVRKSIANHRLDERASRSESSIGVP